MVDQAAAHVRYAHRLAQTFECRPTPSGLPDGALPDELAIDWGGIPAGAQASFYLPAVGADKILALAGRLYYGKPLTRTDDYTVSCNAAGVTYIPIPAGAVPGPNHAGLFTLALPPGLPDGRRYQVRVRQLTTVDQVESVRDRSTPSRRKLRKVVGAFQITLTIHSPEALLIPSERSLALFRWIFSTLEPSDRWYPVLKRYIGELEGRVKTLGANPELFEPSPIGAIPGDAKAGGSGWQQDEELRLRGRRRWAGKIESLVYDRFGEFDSFVLETDAGEKVHFHSRERHIEELARFVWQARIRISVVSGEREPYLPERIILHYPSSHDLLP